MCLMRPVGHDHRILLWVDFMLTRCRWKLVETAYQEPVNVARLIARASEQGEDGRCHDS